jgi:decaprenylphospho-beta-D-erythro-pentofuranosid-2-ulose 2-reductase
MNNAFAEPQTILLLGGNSDIGVAIVRELLSPATRTVVLACRDIAKGEAVAAGLRHDKLSVEVAHFDGANTDSHGAFVRDIAERHGDIDTAIVAFALLGDGAVTSTDPIAAAQVAHVNFTGCVSATIAVANQMRMQGHGDLVLLSSVAGERVRKANPVYGGSKAGIDGFAQGLSDALVGHGVHMLIVRPGFVHSSMTTGREAAPFSSTPESVAKVTAAGLRNRKRIVWAPPLLRFVFMALRHVPTVVWRRLPLGD